MEFRKHRERWLRHLVSSPFIYMMILPIVIMDIFIEIYHRICFPLYGIPCVKRCAYIRIDRHRLEYLTFSEKLNCAYCGYANGLAAYLVRIAGDTERYWCGIKHKKEVGFEEQPHQKDFLEYDDKRSFEEFCKK